MMFGSLTAAGPQNRLWAFARAFAGLELLGLVELGAGHFSRNTGRLPLADGPFLARWAPQLRMGVMVSADTRARIERLLSEGGKPTAVARLCGVKPGVVRRVRDKARQFFTEVAAAAEGNQVVEALGDRPADGGPGDRPADDDWESLQVRRQKWAVMSPALAKRLRRALSCRISRRGNDPAEAQEAAQLVAGQILNWCLVQAEKIRCARL